MEIYQVVGYLDKGISKSWHFRAENFEDAKKIYRFIEAFQPPKEN